MGNVVCPPNLGFSDIVMDELRQNVEFRERAFTFASGNDGDVGWVTGYEMLTDNRFTSAIGAINSAGFVDAELAADPGLIPTTSLTVTAAHSKRLTRCGCSSPTSSVDPEVIFSISGNCHM